MKTTICVAVLLLVAVPAYGQVQTIEVPQDSVARHDSMQAAADRATPEPQVDASLMLMEGVLWSALGAGIFAFTTDTDGTDRSKGEMAAIGAAIGFPVGLIGSYIRQRRGD